MKGIDRRKFMGSSGAAMLVGSQMLPKNSSAKKQVEKVLIPDEPVTVDDYRALKATAREIHSANRMTIDGYSFHMPSRDLYLSLFGWDSGWHAITMTRIDPQIAASEIDFLLSLQLPSGRVSHDTHFEQIDIEPSFKNWIGTKMGKNQFDEQGRSAFIDPPSYIIAAEKIYAQTKDRAWLDRVLPRMERCIYYLTHDRDLFGDGLVSVVHPWETGTDSSPAYDEILGLDFNTPIGAPRRGLMYPAMIDRHAKLGWDIKRIAEKNEFILEDVTFNSITIRGILAIANLNEAIGKHDRALKFRAQAKQMVAALDRVNWDDADGCYFSRYDLKDPKLAMRTTCASLLPMLTGLVEEDKVERIVKEHLLNPQEFWVDYLVPFNAKDELDREKVYMEDLLLWRGHCIWININWMLTEALMTYGYRDEAREIVRRTAKMIRHQGFREFYDYRTGQGKGATTFNWPGLVLDMIAMTWPEAMPA